jgi:hypothetical protein
MRPFAVLIILGLLVAGSLAAVAGVVTVRKEGPVKLQEAGPFDDGKIVKVPFGKTVKATAKLRLDEFFDRRIINANVEVKNEAKVPMFFHYYVAFFDAKGELLGCAGQGDFGDDGLKPGEKTQLGSCLIFLPHGDAKRVASYKITWYESEKAIGAD